MGIQDLQKFLESQVPGACVPVDLLKIARSVSIRQRGGGQHAGHRGGGPRGLGYGGNKLTLVVDGECCLDRLYGGFFSDWVCGGQWNRMVQFLAVLIQTVQSNNMELAVFFNGALEQQRLGEWANHQNSVRKNVNSVLKHIATKGTPPPKVWWVAPVGLRTCFRMALRHLNIQVLCTMDDHHQEVIAFCRENNYHGLMAEDAEYIIFDPPRYFSSHQLKLTYKGSLETREFILDEVAKGLQLPRNYFCLLAALLGNYLLTEKDLHDFYATLIPSYDRQQTSREEVIRAVVKFVVNRCDVNNLLNIGAQVFGSISDPRVGKFKESVQYFLNGTKDGFLRYKPFTSGRDASMRQPHHTYHTRPEIIEPQVKGVEESCASTVGVLQPSQQEHSQVEDRAIQDNKKGGTDSVTQCSGSLDLPVPPQIVIEVTGPGSSPHGSGSGSRGSQSGSHSPDPAELEQALESRLGGFTIVVTNEDAEEEENQGDDEAEDGDEEDECEEEENRVKDLDPERERPLQTGVGGNGGVGGLLDTSVGGGGIGTGVSIGIGVGVGSLRVKDIIITKDDGEEIKSGDLADDHDHDSGIICGGCLGSNASGSPGASLLLSSSSSSSNSSAASPYRLTPDVSWAAQMYRTNNHGHASDTSTPTDSSHPRGSASEGGPRIDTTPLPLPPVPHEVMRTASERHQKGLMSPWIYQVLTQGEVKFGVCLEDENIRELPNAALFFRPVRQSVYAILFNLHHHTFMARKAKEEGHGGPLAVPDIKIREWLYSKANPYDSPDLVEATPVNWAVPTIQRLWFGSVLDDKKRRLRAFLTCMNSDTPLMLHTSYVPQHLLIMATVLRYIMSSPDGPILRKQELDSFLATAFSPDLTNAHYLQDLQLPLVTPRGAQLASLFMMGVETALFANDACGAPVPWLMCCPWLFFDGKLFHAKLIKANYARCLVEVCDNQIDVVAKVERCRQAILENLKVEFACPPLHIMPGMAGYKMGPPPPPPPPPPFPPMGPPPGIRGRGRGHPGHRGMNPNRLYSRGGQLEVAGVVVGSWGPNYGSGGQGSRGGGGRGGRFQQVRRGGGRGGANRDVAYVPMNRPQRPMATRGRPTVLAKKNFVRKKELRPNKGRGMTIAMDSPGGSRTVGVREYVTTNNTPNGDISVANTIVDKDALNANYKTSSGFKSPDSGVNVSILE